MRLWEIAVILSAVAVVAGEIHEAIVVRRFYRKKDNHDNGGQHG